MAASRTSGRITMPAPPPNGLSSTVRCLSVAYPRMSTASIVQIPSARPRPASEWPSGPGNISGNRVSTMADHTGFRSVSDRTLILVFFDLGQFRRVDHDPSGFDVDHRHRLQGEGNQDISLVTADLDDVAGTEIEHRLDGSQRLAGWIFRRQADQVGDVELVLVRLGQGAALDIELGALQRFGLVTVIDTVDFRRHHALGVDTGQFELPFLTRFAGQRPVGGQIGGIGGERLDPQRTFDPMGADHDADAETIAHRPADYSALASAAASAGASAAAAAAAAAASRAFSCSFRRSWALAFGAPCLVCSGRALAVM